METGCGKTTDVIVINDGSVTINEDLDSQASYSIYDDVSGLGGIMSYNNFEDSHGRGSHSYERNTSGTAIVELIQNKVTLVEKFAYNPFVIVSQYHKLDTGGAQGDEFLVLISEHIPLLHRVGAGKYRGPRKIIFMLAHGGVFENNSIIESRKNPTWYDRTNGGYLSHKDEHDVSSTIPNDEQSTGDARDGDYHLEISQERDNALIYLPAMTGSETRGNQPITGNVLDIGCKLKFTKKGLHPTRHVQQYSVTALLNNASSTGETNLGGKFIFTHIT